ncbi:MAG: hypothetical protein HQ564_04340 [Candidatus Saganbacteria bacterium]|nr:hypothetical protein [Candidatus Saganbacteria bacterium]
MKRSFKKISVKELAVLVCSYLEKNGIEAVLTGGSCVSIFSNNKYQSFDLDFVTSAVEYDAKKLKKTMNDLGFIKGKTGYFERSDCKYFIEFIGPPLAIGGELVLDLKSLKTKWGYLKMLSPTECVKDRLSAFYHWNDLQSLEQAILVAKDQKVNLKEVERWSKAERQIKKYSQFCEQIQN